MALDIVIMAAGKGTRMKSSLPKVLHRLAGRPLLLHVLDTCAPLQADRTVVITGYAADAVEQVVTTHTTQGIACPDVRCVRQQPQLGTGHAVQQAAPLLDDDGTTLILNGDVPLIAADTARALVQACAGRQLALLTLTLDHPEGYGRIVRERGQVHGIVEHKDASVTQRSIREVYTGIMAAPTAALKHWLARLTNRNAQGEYYLTDVVAMAVADGVPVVSSTAHDETEVLGVNSAAQLADLERRLQRRHAETLMEAGVRLADPARFDVRGELLCGSDVEIDIDCIFEGRVVLGDGVRVGAHCVIRDTTIGAGTEVMPHCDFTQATIGERVQIGPFARLRPGADLGPEVHIGNFVEVKNSRLERGAKANHLAYLGDTSVGERVNYGAGSITANYDGANKHRTLIGNDVHVGSNCVLVAPLTIGDGATIGAGSVINKNAPAGQLTVARARQASLDNWKRPVKPKKT
jgi:bifunctional UDP-N-acetylglucosamine pyrophosphorylase / glucosamine-1-phosphate N-acetyltransferase